MAENKEIQEEDVEKVIQSEVKASLKARLGNPFVCSFIFSWIVINWQFLLVLGFGDGQIIERIDLVKKDYMSLSSVMYWPLFSSIMFVSVEPWLKAGALFIQTKAVRLCRVLNYKREASSEKDMELVRISNEGAIVMAEKNLADARRDLGDSEKLTQSFEEWQVDREKWDRNKMIKVDDVSRPLKLTIERLEYKVKTLEGELESLTAEKDEYAEKLNHATEAYEDIMRERSENTSAKSIVGWSSGESVGASLAKTSELLKASSLPGPFSDLGLFPGETRSFGLRDLVTKPVTSTLGIRPSSDILPQKVHSPGVIIPPGGDIPQTVSPAEPIHKENQSEASPAKPIFIPAPGSARTRRKKSQGVEAAPSPETAD